LKFIQFTLKDCIRIKLSYPEFDINGQIQDAKTVIRSIHAVSIKNIFKRDENISKKINLYSCSKLFKTIHERGLK